MEAAAGPCSCACHPEDSFSISFLSPSFPVPRAGSGLAIALPVVCRKIYIEKDFLHVEIFYPDLLLDSFFALFLPIFEFCFFVVWPAFCFEFGNCLKQLKNVFYFKCGSDPWGGGGNFR